MCRAIPTQIPENGSLAATLPTKEGRKRGDSYKSGSLSSADGIAGTNRGKLIRAETKGRDQQAILGSEVNVGQTATNERGSFLSVLSEPSSSISLHSLAGSENLQFRSQGLSALKVDWLMGEG